MLHSVPWDDVATLTRVNHVSGLREQAASGPLRIILEIVERDSWIERKDLRIMFPERVSPPFGYGPENFNDLIRLVREQP